MVTGTRIFIEVHRCRLGKEISHVACVTPVTISSAVGMIILKRSECWIALTSPGGMDLANTQKAFLKLNPSPEDNIGLTVASTGNAAGYCFLEVNEA